MGRTVTLGGETVLASSESTTRGGGGHFYPGFSRVCTTTPMGWQQQLEGAGEVRPPWAALPHQDIKRSRRMGCPRI